MGEMSETIFHVQPDPTSSILLTSGRPTIWDIRGPVKKPYGLFVRSSIVDYVAGDLIISVSSPVEKLSCFPAVVHWQLLLLLLLLLLRQFIGVRRLRLVDVM